MILASSYSESWHFLNQEAYLIASCLGNGLTAIRQAPTKGKGCWYAAFFQLSTGLERLMKAIIVVEHINRHQLAALTSKVLKDNYGHDLLSLLESVEKIEVNTKPHPASTINKESTAYQILSFFNGFAKRSRYYNLDSLTGSQSGVDPLADWGTILARIITEDVPEQKRDRILAEASLIAKSVGQGSIVIVHGLDQSPLTLEQFIQATPIQDVASGYAVCHVLDIARPLEVVLSDLTHASYGVFGGGVAQVPDMWEHLTFLREPRCSDVRRKKCWP